MPRDTPRSFDRPVEADAAPNSRAWADAAAARLAALGAHLGAHGFDVELTRAGLVVGNASAVGCCPDVPVKADTITCRPRRSDRQRLWYSTSWQQPITDADRVTDACVAIKGYLGAPR